MTQNSQPLKHKKPSQLAAVNGLKDQRRRTYLENHNAVIKKQRHVCFHRLLGKRRCPDANNHTGMPKCFLPAIQDHLEELVVDGKTKIIIAQPYEISNTDLTETLSFCRERGINMTISRGESWHNPGRTFLVEYTLVDK
jgi:hypothetical protein